MKRFGPAFARMDAQQPSRSRIVSEAEAKTESHMVQPKPLKDQNYGHDPQPSTTTAKTGQPSLTPEQSRQGVISGRVMMVLATSLVLALIAFVILYSAEIV
jgi:hypothetical protein